MPHSSRRLILLVEDNPGDRILTTKALELTEIPHTLVVARDGVEALDYLFATGPHAGRDLATNPTLVLLDAKMPRMDGFGVLERVRADERTRLTPIVMLTSSLEEKDLRRSYLLGVNSYLRKPLDFECFANAIRVLA
ncbi:MAG: response regulator, partial [Gemmatimonadota bacterium]